jgi:hypothetical protein
MRIIETTVRVDEERKANILLELPPDVLPGDYNMLIMMEEEAINPVCSRMTEFGCLAWDWDALPKKAAYRREDIYGVDGR